MIKNRGIVICMKILLLVVVVLIVSLLICVFSWDSYEISSENSKYRYNVRTMEALSILIEGYKDEIGVLPSTELWPSELYEADMYKNIDVGNLEDAWGRSFKYKMNKNNINGFELWTYGRDNKEGGRGEDKDVYYTKGAKQYKGSAISAPLSIGNSCFLRFFHVKI